MGDLHGSLAYFFLPLIGCFLPMLSPYSTLCKASASLYFSVCSTPPCDLWLADEQLQFLLHLASHPTEVNIGQRRRRMNLVKVSPSVLPTVFRQLEIYPDIQI